VNWGQVGKKKWKKLKDVGSEQSALYMQHTPNNPPKLRLKILSNVWYKMRKVERQKRGLILSDLTQITLYIQLAPESSATGRTSPGYGKHRRSLVDAIISSGWGTAGLLVCPRGTGPTKEDKPAAPC